MYPHSAPSRNGRPRVASAAVASPSGTHAQSSSVARGDTAIGVRVSPKPERSRVTSPRFWSLSCVLSSGDASPPWPFDARLGPGSAYRPPACAPTKTSAPPPSPRREITPAPNPSNAERGVDGNVRDHRVSSFRVTRFCPGPGDDIIVTAFPLSKRSVGKSPLPSESRSGSTRRRSRRRATNVAAPRGPGFVSGCTSPYVTFHRSAPVFASTERTLYSVRPTKTAPRSSGEDASSAAAASRAKTSKSASPSASPGAACITTPSAVNVRSSVPRSASSAKTTLVRVPSTSAPSRVMDGDASTSCLAVTGRRATAAFVSSPVSAFGDSDESAYSAPSTPGNTTAGPPRVDRSATASVSSPGGWSHSPRAGRACARTSGPPDEKLHSDSPVARATACTVPSRRDTSNGESFADCASRSPLERVASAATHATRSAHAARRRRMPRYRSDAPR